MTTRAPARIRYRGPYDWAAMLGHLRARAIDGVEVVTDDAYERGDTRVTHEVSKSELVVEGDVERVRALFDVDADVLAIGKHLARDPLLAPLVAARPGLRRPGAWDGFELAVRAVLGQQITVVAARKLGGQLVRICGTTAFPTAHEVAAANLDALGMPRSRKATLHAIATAALEDPCIFQSNGDLASTLERLRAIRGVGDWTAQYIALRAARESDAFPSTDVALLRASGLDARALVKRAERWRPWRAYAAQHLWASLV